MQLPLRIGNRTTSAVSSTIANSTSDEKYSHQLINYLYSFQNHLYFFQFSFRIVFCQICFVICFQFIFVCLFSPYRKDGTVVYLFFVVGVFQSTMAKYFTTLFLFCQQKTLLFSRAFSPIETNKCIFYSLFFIHFESKVWILQLSVANLFTMHTLISSFFVSIFINGILSQLLFVQI